MIGSSQRTNFSSISLRGTEYLSLETLMILSRELTSLAPSGAKVSAEKDRDVAPFIIKRRTISYLPKFTKSWAKNSGENCNSKTCASSEPIPKQIVEPTLPKTAAATNSSNCSMY